MRITPEILLAMEFEKQGGGNYVLTHNGYAFQISQKSESEWDFCCHSITDVEEMIGFAYNEGFINGEESTKLEIARTLGVVSAIQPFNMVANVIGQRPTTIQKTCNKL